MLKRLPFRDKSFDPAISSYVAHGFMPVERHTLYSEMQRVARHTAALFDYGEQHSLITDIAEWLEGGDSSLRTSGMNQRINSVILKLSMLVSILLWLCIFVKLNKKTSQDMFVEFGEPDINLA